MEIKYEVGDYVLALNESILPRFALVSRAYQYLVEKAHDNEIFEILKSIAVTDQTDTRQLLPYHELPKHSSITSLGKHMSQISLTDFRVSRYFFRIRGILV